MITFESPKTLKKWYGDIKPVNKISRPVIVRIKKGYILEFWSIEEVIIGEKKDPNGTKTFTQYY